MKFLLNLYNGMNKREHHREGKQKRRTLISKYPYTVDTNYP